MKLAEALLERKALQARITELQGRYTAAAVIEEDSTSDESPDELLTGLNAAFDRMEQLVVAVNTTNNQVLVGERTMMEALAHRDTLKAQVGHYNAICGSIRQRNQQRRFYTESGPKMVVAEGVSAGYFIKLVDDLSKELRLLDAAVQAANWMNDLVE